MVEVSILTATNEVLKVINHLPLAYSSSDIAGVLYTNGISVSKYDLNLILVKLLKDEYILKTEANYKGGSDMYEITWEGKEFISKGGYKESLRDDLLPTISPEVNTIDNTKHNTNSLINWGAKNKSEIVKGVIIAVLAVLILHFIFHIG
jgi:hypothetical protein